MTRILLFSFVSVLIFSCSSNKKEESGENNGSAKQESQPQVSYATYGDEITPDDFKNDYKLDLLLNDQDSVDNVKIEATIEKTCKMKGCWMKVTTPHGNSMRVTFKDYGFFVPKEGQEGKKAIIQGQLKQTETSIETLRHMAQDEGKPQEEIDKITTPKAEYKFVATGVLIEEGASKKEETTP